MPRKTQTKPKVPSKTKVIAKEESYESSAMYIIGGVALVVLVIFIVWKSGYFAKKSEQVTPEYELLQLEASSEPVMATLEERGAELRALEAQSSQKQEGATGTQ